MTPKSLHHPAQAICRNGTLPASLLLATVAIIVAGCQASGIKATDLPPQLRAEKIYGAQHVDLSRFAQGDLKNEVIYSGDTIEVSLATGLEGRHLPRYKLRVDETGAVNVPLVVLVRVGGLHLTEAESWISEASVARGIYRNPQVALTIDRRRSNQITILGAVKKEGTYELPSNQSDLVSAIVAAGGLTTEASTVVEVRRPPGTAPVPGPNGVVSLASYNGRGPAQLDRFDLKKTENLDPRRFTIEDGATVMIKPRPKQAVQVLGLVKRPGQFELEPDQEMRLLDAVAMAGGLDTELANRVIVVRQVKESGDSVVIDATIRGAKSDHLENLVLAPGDVVSVEETPLTFVARELNKYVRLGVSASSRLAF